MRITSVETIPVLVPVRPRLAIRSSLGAHTESPFVIVRVHTDEGITGLGEVSCTPVWSGEDQVTAVRVIREYLEPALRGTEATAVEAAAGLMRRAVAGNPFTKSGIEMALWDIAGKAAGMPLYRLLGGPVREFVPLKFSISGALAGHAAEIAAWAVSEGFRAMKVKVAIDPEDDVARVEAVRRAAPGVRLGIDANGGWRPYEAVRMIRRLCEYGIYFAEQPVPPGDPQWLADVRRQVGVPVMADESVYTPQDAIALVRAQAADVFSVYVGKAGIGAARKTAAIAEAAGLTCTVGSNLELGIASAAMIHLAMATPGIGAEEFPCDILGYLFYEQDVLAEALPIESARARPPEKPGLGVELDKAELQRLSSES